MVSKSIKEFQSLILDNLSFIPEDNGHYIIYRNALKPELGYLIKYFREDYYELLIGDYTICKDFSLSFDHNEEIIRLGIVYKGETEFKLADNTVSSFSPSSFFVNEKGLRGKQSWKKGQHFHGAEITIHKKYFDEVIIPNFANTLNFDNLITNYTYNYLPLDVTSIINNLSSLAQKEQLLPLYLESKILESIALIENELKKSDNVFTNQFNYGDVKIGNNRYVTLTSSDMHAIQKAHDILTDDPCNPPTISNLSKIVYLNEQKLKAGFLAKYHMTIGQYSSSIRMSLAENLLCTTELSVEEISKKLGYHHSGNFVKAFKKAHGKTPLAFRKNRKI